MPTTPQDDAVDWIRDQADRMDPHGPPLVLLCPGPATRRAAETLADAFDGPLTIEYGSGMDHVVLALGRALRALGAQVQFEDADIGLWGGEYRTLTRHRPGLLVVITGAREPAQVRALLPTGRGSLVLVAEEEADLRELEIHPGARVCDAPG